MVKEAVNPKKGMTDRQAQEFIRNHFEELVNRKNVTIARVDFAPNFVRPRGGPAAGITTHPGRKGQY
jgi:hypothetical protein